jgi:hypothetical protein
MNRIFRIVGGASALLLMASCGGSESSGATAVTAPDPAAAAPAAAGLPSMYGQFYGVQASLDGATVVLRATSVPDHKSPYFGSGNALYEPPAAGMVVNPNRIESQAFVLRVPASPAIASPSDTNLGPIGVAVNGVALFNQYAANRTPLDDEIRTFDRYNGHPSPNNMYHYHTEPLYLTAQGSSRLLGVLLDGFPVYGTQDADGRRPTDLDACNGHVRATPEFPAGIYHYHVVATPPYISGCFRGTPGGRG